MFINKFLNLSIFDGSEDSLEDPSFTDHNHGEFRGGETNEMKVELQQAPKSRPGGPQSADLWSGPALEGQTGAALREEPSPLLGEICQRPGVMDEMKSMMEKQVRDRESESDLITLKSDIMTLLEKCKRFTDTIWDSDEQKCQKNKVMTLELEKENKEISKELATLKDKLFNMLSLKDKFLKLTKQREFVQGQKAWLGSQISNLKLKIQNEEALLMSTLGLSAKELEEKYKEEFSQIKLLQGQRAQLHTEFNHLRSKSSVASSLRGRVSNLKDEKRDGKSQQINKKTAICTQQRRKAAATCPKQADVLKCDGNSQRKKQDTILREKEEVLKSPKDNETISSLKDVKNETTVLKWETITSSTSICKPKHIQTQLEAVGSDAIAMMKKEESLTGEIPASQEQQLLQSTPQCAAAEKTGLESEPLSKIEELKLRQRMRQCVSVGQPSLEPIAES
ncbi:uncharacterized protein LOC112146611 [Oryzias melastigma]|uniref:uncharacterized protein LOC112146611 n=1 Tax=Oryzias melastigma TaxID=30732 RepID=UPI000CF7B438|nr:uncharacterized protein LOC112146611 [Oryzias melastigma]